MIDSAADLRVARALGVESEMELPGVVLKTRLDLDDAASIRAAVTDAVERLGALDVLVANAVRWPIDARGPLSESDPDVWARALRANLEGTAQRCARRCPI